MLHPEILVLQSSSEGRTPTNKLLKMKVQLIDRCVLPSRLGGKIIGFRSCDLVKSHLFEIQKCSTDNVDNKYKQIM